MHSVPGGYASVPGYYAKILEVMLKFLEVMVLFQVVMQPIVGIELLWQLKHFISSALILKLCFQKLMVTSVKLW